MLLPNTVHRLTAGLSPQLRAQDVPVVADNSAVRMLLPVLQPGAQSDPSSQTLLLPVQHTPASAAAAQHHYSTEAPV